MTAPMIPTRRGQTAAPDFEQALPNVFRWRDPAGSDRCGTALITSDGLVLVDPPELPEVGRSALELAGVRYVVLTNASHAALAEPFRTAGASIWALGDVDSPPAGIDRSFTLGDSLPGGLLAVQLPTDAAPPGEVSLLWPDAGGGLLIAGDVLPVVGQTPIYLEGVSAPFPRFFDLVRALLAAEPGTLAPTHQSPPSRPVMYSTGYAGHIGSPSHARRAAPVEGPRFLVPQAERALAEALEYPVVVRRAAGETDVESRWVADPFACIRCGRPNQPLPPTCGGPPIPQLCAECRAAQRTQAPEARLMVCAGGCCTREGARAVVSAARREVQQRGLTGRVEVVPVSCLGECSLGPFLRVATARGAEPDFARDYREQTVQRARQYAKDEDEIIDDESELVLSRFAALVQPDEAVRLVRELDQ